MSKYLLSQLQNSSARKTALLSPIAPALPRLPSRVGRRQCVGKAEAFPERSASKSSIFRCRGVLQLALLSFLLCLMHVANLSGVGQKQNESMLQHLDLLEQLMKTKYAPFQWKQREYQWNIDEQIAMAKIKVLANEKLSIKEYQRIVRDLLCSTYDSHVDILFYSTEESSLPFSITGIEGKYYITAINRNQLPLEDYPIQVGDEITHIDGQPIASLIEQILSEEVFEANPFTAQSKAERIFSWRSGAFGHDVPKGPVHITIISRGLNRTSQYQLMWDYHPEIISNWAFPEKESIKKSSWICKDFRNSCFLHPFSECFLAYHEKMTNSYEGVDVNLVGNKQSSIPELGEVIWKSLKNNFYQAYIFHDSKQRSIGFIRIPHYVIGLEGSERRCEDFEKIIRIMQKRTDVLVIDQLNNCGGNAFFMYTLLSMLTDQPLITPNHCVKITHREIFTITSLLDAIQMINSTDQARLLLGSSFDGYPVNYQFASFIKYFGEFLIDEWKQGRRLTGPIHLWGVDQINPHPRTRYTKPILMLVNHLCFSAGEFAPAILQDNQRAIIMGSQTAGAGGAVERIRYPNDFGIDWISLTTTFAKRANDQPIENIGVIPDVAYSVTKNDILDSFVDFRGTILEVLDQISF